MITTRLSGAREKNGAIRQDEERGSNREWLAALDPSILRPGAVLLLGGSGVVDFRLRVAQSHLRHDLLPSFWSQAGVVASGESFLSVPLDERLNPSRVPPNNAIHECSFGAYDDPGQYPNIAILNFAEPPDAAVDHARRLQTQRSAIDLPQLLVSWLAFAWGAGAVGNPLMQNVGIPGAALVETAFGIAGIELTPGVASAASCPEAIWQSAIWWHEYYERAAGATVRRTGERAPKRDRDMAAIVVPHGAYVTRQPAAAVVESGHAPTEPSPAREAGGAAKARRSRTVRKRARPR